MLVCKYGFDNGKYGLRFVVVSTVLLRGSPVCKVISRLLCRYVNTGLFGKYSL